MTNRHRNSLVFAMVFFAGFAVYNDIRFRKEQTKNFALQGKIYELEYSFDMCKFLLGVNK